MSNSSGPSIGSSNSRGRCRIVGVPTRCWCGELVVPKTSKSESNPYRRYFRCAYAATNKLIDDKHTFKWIDEALLNEIESLASKNTRFEQQLKEITNERLEFEKEIFERVEKMLVNANSKMVKMMFVVVVAGLLVMIGILKLL